MPERSERGSLSGHRQNERWLREHALTASRGPIVITDPNEPDNPIVYANPAFERITGYSVEEAVGKNCRFLQGEDRDQPALEELRAAIREGRECRVVLHNYKKDGTLFWNELSISPVHDEQGNLANFVGVLDDVTERKRMEEALKSQARQVALRADVAAALSSGDTLSDVLERWEEAMVRHLNAAFARVWTLNEEEDVLELQASAGIYTHTDGPHSRVPVGELKIGLIAQERLPHVTNTVTSDPRVSDKEWARREGMIAFAGYPLIVEDRLVGVMAMFARQALAEDTMVALESVATAVAQGIERKRAEEAVEQSELLYRTVIEQATENIFLVDVETRRIVESNPAFQETLGYKEEELRSLTLYDIIATDRKSIDRNIRRVLEQKHRFVGERKYRRKDGSLVDVEVSASIILRNDRETLCVVAHDVTERKRMEEAQRFLAEAGATLSSSLEYRTTLASVARLAVPRLADWCAVDIVEEDGSLERLAVEHEDPQKVQLARELQERYPPDPEASRGVRRVVRSGRSEFYPDITDEMLVAAARDAQHLRLMREIGFVSAIIVPLVARGRTLGAITLVSAE